MYKLMKFSWDFESKHVVKNNENETTTCIPFDPANTDAKEFAKWLSEGGIPEAAVEGETVSAEWIAETISKLS